MCVRSAGRRCLAQAILVFSDRQAHATLPPSLRQRQPFSHTLVPLRPNCASSQRQWSWHVSARLAHGWLAAVSGKGAGSSESTFIEHRVLLYITRAHVHTTAQLVHAFPAARFSLMRFIASSRAAPAFLASVPESCSGTGAGAGEGPEAGAAVFGGGPAGGGRACGALVGGVGLAVAAAGWPRGPDGGAGRGGRAPLSLTAGEATEPADSAGLGADASCGGASLLATGEGPRGGAARGGEGRAAGATGGRGASAVVSSIGATSPACASALCLASLAFFNASKREAFVCVGAASPLLPDSFLLEAGASCTELGASFEAGGAVDG